MLHHRNRQHPYSSTNTLSAHRSSEAPYSPTSTLLMLQLLLSRAEAHPEMPGVPAVIYSFTSRREHSAAFMVNEPEDQYPGRNQSNAPPESSTQMKPEYWSPRSLGGVPTTACETVDHALCPKRTQCPKWGTENREGPRTGFLYRVRCICDNRVDVNASCDDSVGFQRSNGPLSTWKPGVFTAVGRPPSGDV